MQIRSLEEVEAMTDGLAFPEGPVPMPDGSVLVVEISGGRLTRVDTDGSTDTVADLGGGPNGAAIGPDGSVYVCNNGGMTPESRSQPGIQRVDPVTGEFEYVYTASEGAPLVAPNDLVFDGTGGFWFTDFGGGTVHYAASNGSSISTAVSGLAFPNGIGLSPTGDILYWSQTHTRQVMRRRVTKPGELEASVGHGIAALVAHGEVDDFSLLAGLPGFQELDSLAVDAGGSVCVGTLVEGGITEFGPEGGLDNVVRWTLPDELYDGAVTNIAFGGADLRTAYITCSLTGRLLRCPWHRAGLPPAHGS